MFTVAKGYFFLFFFDIGYHHLLNRNCLETILHFWRSAVPYRVKWCEKESRKLRQKESVHCINYFGVSGQTSPATVAVLDDKP